MLTALWLQPPLWEVPWEHHCWNYREEGLHSRIFPDRIQSSLSEGEKGLCWAHPRTLWLPWGPESVPSALPWTWQQNRQSGDIPLPTTVSGLTYWKQKQQKKQQEEIYTNFLRCCSREAQANQALSPSLLFPYVKRKKKIQRSATLIHRLQTPLSGPQTGDRKKGFQQSLLQVCWCVRELKKSCQLTKWRG